MSSIDFAYVYQKVEKRVPTLQSSSFVICRKDVFDFVRLMSKFNSNLYYQYVSFEREGSPQNGDSKV